LSTCLGLLSTSCLAREIKRIHVDAIKLYDYVNDPLVQRECKNFRPTNHQIKHFFSRAYPVEHYIMSHPRYSPCYATGSIEFADGHFGTWKLRSSGAALLTFNRGDEVTLFYPTIEWNDPFEGMYDDNDED
jgi:hypothetical protein